MDLLDIVAKLSLDSSNYNQGLEDAGKKATTFGGRAKKKSIVLEKLNNYFDKYEGLL